MYLSSRARQHFVFVETDATLFADPFPFFESRDTVASVTCAAEVRPPNRGYTGINVGVLSLKADPRVRTALRQLVELMAARPELDDQSELMRELAFFNTEEFEFVDCVASADGFTTVCCGYWPNATYVVHAGGMGGTQGKWHFFQTAGFLLPCPGTPPGQGLSPAATALPVSDKATATDEPRAPEGGDNVVSDAIWFPVAK